jgi:hypothetical protein
MNKLMRRLGFSLIEVVLGAVIIAGFVGTTVYTAGEIGLARRESLASFDRNSWATLQTQYAAEGVMAQSSNSAVWGAADYGVLASKGGSLSFTSTGTNLDASSVQAVTLGTVGRSLCVNSFRVNVPANQIANRSNRNTVGLVLMDRSSYAGTAGNGTTTPALNPGSNPMDKPAGLFGLSTVLGIAKFNPLTGSYVAEQSSTATIDAFTEMNWSGSGPAFYVLIRSTSGSIDGATCQLNGGAGIDMVSTSIGAYTGAFPVPVSALSSLTSSTINVTTAAYDADGIYSYGKATVTIGKVTPVIQNVRVNSGTGATVATNQVWIQDVTQPGTLAYNAFHTRVTGFVTASGSSFSLSSITNASSPYYDNATAILNSLGVSVYVDSVAGATTSTVQVLATNTIPSSGDCVYMISGSAFSMASGATFTQRSVVTPFSNLAFISSSTTVTNSLIPTAVQLPYVDYTPPTGATLSTAQASVSANTSSMDPGTFLGATRLYVAKTTGLYSLYYSFTTDGSAPSDPTPYLYYGVINDTNGIETYGTLTSGVTVKVKTAAHANSPYSLFLSPGAVTPASYTFGEDAVERVTVMKVKKIEDTIDGRVQGSIQVLTPDSFILNGSMVLGLVLYVPDEPSIMCNSSFGIYKTKPEPVPTGQATIVSSVLTRPTNGNTIKGTDSETIMVNSIPSKYSCVIQTSYTTTVPMVAPDSIGPMIATGGHNYTMKSGTATDATWTDNSGKSHPVVAQYIWTDSEADYNYLGSNDYNNSPAKRPVSILMNAGTHNGTITVESGAKLYLNSGQHNFYSLEIREGGQLVANPGALIQAQWLTLNRNVAIRLSTGVNEFANLKMEDESKMLTTSTGVIIHVKTGGFALNGNVQGNQVVLNSDGSLNSATNAKGCVIGTRIFPVKMHVTSTQSADDRINGQFYGTIYSNGKIQLSACLVMGRIESYAIQMNGQNYLFIKEN